MKQVEGNEKLKAKSTKEYLNEIDDDARYEEEWMCTVNLRTENEERKSFILLGAATLYQGLSNLLATPML